MTDPDNNKAQENLTIVNKKNTVAFQQALLLLQEKVYEQDRRIEGLLSTIQTLVSRVGSLETLVVIQKAKLTGLGPTVKE